MLSASSSRPHSGSASAPLLPPAGGTSVGFASPAGSRSVTRELSTGEAKAPQPPIDLKQEQVTACIEAMGEVGKRLPRSMSELRMARNRMPTDALSQLLRSGAGLDEVGEQAALRVVEKLVHGNPLSASPAPLVPIELPPGAMTYGLSRQVPEPESLARGERWKFMEDLTELWAVEQQFDRHSWIHSPPCDAKTKIRVMCGRDPVVWKKRPDYIEDMSRVRGALSTTDRFRVTAATCSTYVDQFLRKPKPPAVGPGHYGSRDPRDWYSLPKQGGPFAGRAVFPSTGRQRGVCTVTSLSFAERTLDLPEP
eukprot:TRINITY_DN52087_c0_g1_i2.p1 TRINITY_DN52087_c0_g1~~TRINITY_DN52087_c0_g1_i2.p1  ORF type:complete len:309 (-),score=49.46 TRINITY_DN52087_c0_g1_i2:69-995(-)